MIRVALDIPDAFVRRARYVFAIFAQQWGVPVEISHGDSEDADLSYSTKPPRGSDGVVHIPFDERLYDHGCRCTAIEDEGFRIWSRPPLVALATDVVASSYRLLTFLDEHEVAPEARDRRGVFLTGALPSARRSVAHVPVVDDQAAWLLERLKRARPAAVGVLLPKWPDGKRYAVALTHDTDVITLGASRELGTSLAKALLRRDRTHARMFVDGLRYIGKPTENPLFGFPLWREFERARRVPSSFYLYARVVSLKVDVNNCKSSVVDQRIDWQLLKDMAADGWEFGFHAPINAKDSLDAFAKGKQWLEARLAAPLYGVRHHYWALDWFAPHMTFRKHVDSGFRYDASIAFRDTSGFRAATCHPYRPFDPERQTPLDLYEIPGCIMDGNVVVSADRTEPKDAALDTVARVRERGGVAVFNWHTESACGDYGYEHYLETLDRLLWPLLDGDAWFATQWDIVRHWHGRSLALGVA